MNELYEYYEYLTSRLGGSFKASKPQLPIQMLPGGKKPLRAHPTDACWDCFAFIPEEGLPYKGTHPQKVSLGFKLAVPVGWKVMLWGKSGLAQDGYKIHIGTIDSGYRDEVKVLIEHQLAGSGDWNWMPQNAPYVPGQKMCQMSLERVWDFEFVVVDDLDMEGDRGGGFGSTGKF